MIPGLLRMDRAVAGGVFRSLLIVCFALIAVYGLLDGVRELKYLGANYGVLDVIWYLVLTTPRRAYQVFPFAALVGAVLAVGALAAAGELVAWRALGATRFRLMVPVMMAVTLLLTLVMWGAEQWATEFELRARSYRLEKITGQVSLSGPAGLWLRDGQDFIHIKYPFLDEALATDFHQVKIYQLGPDAALSGWVTASNAFHSDQQWALHNVHQVSLNEAGAQHHYQAEMTWPSQLDTAALGSSVLRPSLLSISELSALLRYFEGNALDVSHYRAALWRRYFYPLIVWAAVLLGLPFVLSLQGRESRTRALAVAVAVGLAWYVTERLFQSVVLALQWSPVWGGLVPVLMALILTAVLMRRRN